MKLKIPWKYRSQNYCNYNCEFFLLDMTYSTNDKRLAFTTILDIFLLFSLKMLQDKYWSMRILRRISVLKFQAWRSSGLKKQMDKRIFHRSDYLQRLCSFFKSKLLSWKSGNISFDSFFSSETRQCCSLISCTVQS